MLEMDLTQKLPIEIWIEILDRLPSLKEQLKLERVSKRFQRCLIKSFETNPFSLVIDSSPGYLGSVNESRIRRPQQMLDAVRMLADKAKLHSIKSSCPPRMPVTMLESCFSALINSKNRCLDKVTRFELSRSKPSESILLELLTKCTKLSSLELGIIEVHPFCRISSALRGKALTHLKFSLDYFVPSQEQLVALLQALKPNKLKEIKLDYNNSSFDPVALVDDLRVGALAALEQIEFEFLGEVNLADLFASLRRMPKLHKCNIELFTIDSVTQFVSALTPFFSTPIQTRMVVTELAREFPFGCHLVNLIRQVQKDHPMLQIGFEIPAPGLGHDDPLIDLKMSLGHATLEGPLIGVQPCFAAICMDCGSFYPTLFLKLVSMANAKVDAHLEVGTLDRCKIDKVVDDLNRIPVRLQRYKALEVVNNDNRPTIRFGSKLNHHQFNITVFCDRCLSNVCFD